MKALLQCVQSANVRVNGQIVSSIDRGLLVFFGLATGDDPKHFPDFAKKLLELRVFLNERDKFDYSLKDIDGDLLLVSQFTLYADCSKGRRPDFQQAMERSEAEKLFDEFVKVCEEILGKKVQTGVFGAMMQVSLVNDGPTTIEIEIPPDILNAA